MPWTVSEVTEQRERFVREWMRGEATMAELCRGYGIARKTGYKWVERYEEQGRTGLQDRGCAPHRHPNQTAVAVEERVVELRRAHMSWGPRKLRRILLDRAPGGPCPAASTIGALLKREGLAVARRARRRTPPYTAPFAAAEAPNRVWCADFKGWFRAGDGERIDPLTVSDACSRYLLRCQATEKTDTVAVRAILQAAFREYGMPEALRTDNGTPFAARAVAGLSRLAVWLMKLGIVPERIQPGHPEQNGRHERMHRTLKQETATPPAANRRAQQRAFDRFQREYNQERPHEALGMNTPASVYRVSPRIYPERLAEPEYDGGLQVRKIALRGQFSWKHEEVFLTEALIGERVGLEPIDERYWCVYFSTFPIALFDAAARVIRPLPKFEEDGGEEETIGGWKSGNLKSGDSQIPTAAATITAD